MGAQEFEHTGYGDTAEAAFASAIEEAGYEHGHGGYSGTIVEKQSFRMIDCAEDLDMINATMEDCMQDAGHWVQDKWGDAGCIKVREGTYLFFGWASS